jgi:DNA-binding MarR family transcriptional regulator
MSNRNIIKPKILLGALFMTAFLVLSLAPGARGDGAGPQGNVNYNEPYIEICSIGGTEDINGPGTERGEMSVTVCLQNPTNDSVTYHFANGHIFNVTATKGDKVVWRYPPADYVPDANPVNITVMARSNVTLGSATWSKLPNGHFIVRAELVGYKLPSVDGYYDQDMGCDLFGCWASGGAGTYVGEHPAETAAIGVGSGGLIATVGVLAFTEPGKYAGMAIVAPLFTRLKKRKVLDNFTRGRIEGYVMANPGAHMNAIRDAFRLSNGVVAYHLRVLEREGFVTSMIDGLKRRFYPGEKIDIQDKRQELSVIQNLLISIMEKNPGITQTELAKMAGTSPQVVNYHIKKLWRMDLITMDKDGRVVKCWVRKEKLALLKRGEVGIGETGTAKTTTDTP